MNGMMEMDDTIENARLKWLNLELIDPNPQQPRRVFHEEPLGELVDSVKEHGVIQPVVVRRSQVEGRWELIAGERRLRASKRAGLNQIPAVVDDVADKDLLALALVENIQRADLNPIEEAEAIQHLMDEQAWTHEECARKLGKDRTTVVNSLRLLSLPVEVRSDIEVQKISAAHGKILLQLADPQLILQAHKVVVLKGLSVKQTRKLCQSFERAGAVQAPKKDNDLEYIAESLRAMLQTKVRLSGTPSKGRIEVSYFSPSELERILELLKPSGSLF